ncbi:YcxB family protein [Candidatus Syntrophocurvum alkaliphilum]|nr:YcxB family protein [Candidatus Syntrophocurvum alkaliphilum]
MGFIMLNCFINKEYYSDKLIQQEFKCIINNEGIEQINTRNSKSKSFSTWDDFVSAQEYKDVFFLFVSRRNAVIIPKRFFYSNEDIKTFKAFINKYIIKSL